MKFVISALALAGAAVAGTQVNWYGCSGESDRTVANEGGCTNVAGFHTTNLCGILVPPPGTDRCEFYTTSCGNPFGDTYYCSVASGRCDTRHWPAIDSYRCWSR
ncbi:hypothetical protein NLG97_g6360 [Lecanicillium saksenae]|uniref:Uncharacterized protein n=1 Tax=Lecanicillium saksenae TaxID=468837 RepID=A0ACC1QPW4_9HYPO|nr:hypothetical protein NLG97_g6360 [Lecanicillium saksenae]